MGDLPSANKFLAMILDEQSPSGEKIKSIFDAAAQDKSIVLALAAAFISHHEIKNMRSV